MAKPLVIYHDDCADGFGAAFAAWLKLGDGAEYLPHQYNGPVDPRLNNPLNLGGLEIYIFDFSFPRERMEFLFTNAKRVVWLDHHKTAFEMWCDDGERNRCEQSNGNDEVLLDNNKSGAILVWEFFHPGTEVPLLIQHIDDRDRWQFKLRMSAEIHAALSSIKPWSFEQWQELIADEHYGSLCSEGSAILRAQNAAVAQAVKHARHIYVPCELSSSHFLDSTATGLAVSCPLHQSEIGHELANKSGTFGLVWYMKEDGGIICSLRSNGDYDVSAIAKAFGGGGHKNAAGFQIDAETLMGWLK